MNFQEWSQTVPDAITSDSLWRVKAHRLALYLIYLAWSDCEKITKDKRHFAMADQLYRSVGSIAANLSEGYSRHTDLDQARFYNYSLGSTREARDWYYAALPFVCEAVIQHRYSVISEITALVVSMIKSHRDHKIHEEASPYQLDEE